MHNTISKYTKAHSNLRAFHFLYWAWEQELRSNGWHYVHFLPFRHSFLIKRSWRLPAFLTAIRLICRNSVDCLELQFCATHAVQFTQSKMQIESSTYIQEPEWTYQFQSDRQISLICVKITQRLCQRQG